MKKTRGTCIHADFLLSRDSYNYDTNLLLYIFLFIKILEIAKYGDLDIN